jgi:hypothetical protein
MELERYTVIAFIKCFCEIIQKLRGTEVRARVFYLIREEFRSQSKDDKPSVKECTF